MDLLLPSQRRLMFMDPPTPVKLAASLSQFRLPPCSSWQQHSSIASFQYNGLGHGSSAVVRCGQYRLWRKGSADSARFGAGGGRQPTTVDGPHRLRVGSNIQEKTVDGSELPIFTQAEFERFLLNMQNTICATAAEADGSGRLFGEDRWQRGDYPRAGYGITRVMEDGDLLEKAAVNVSIVRGQLSESRAKAMSARGRDVGSGAHYFAGALSLVFHSRSPYVPTFRSDVRYFEVEGVGGGADLTPSYLFEEDAVFFHSYYRGICDKFDPTSM